MLTQRLPIGPEPAAWARAGSPRQRRVTITVGLTVMVCLLSSVRVVIEAPRPSQLKAMSRAIAERSDLRFAGLRRALPERGVVGYVGEASENEVADYYLAQYALVPLVVEHSQDHPFVVGNFPSSRAASTPTTTQDLVLVKDFGNGVLLLAKKGDK